MSEIVSYVDRDQINSIVLGVAENKARNMGVTIEPGAFDALLRKAKQKLDMAHEKGDLSERRDEIAGNTEKLIEHIIGENMKFDKGELTAQMMTFSLKSICDYFEDLYPFCP
jgi:hypothetical protein